MPITTLDPITALIVIDLQAGIVALPTAHPATEVVARAAALAAGFRRHGLPVPLSVIAEIGRLIEELDREPAQVFVDVKFVTTAEGDTRVDPCHARKMAALLTQAGAGQEDQPILLLQHGRAGHGVGKPAAMRVAEGADVLAFFTWQLDLDEVLAP